MQSPRSMMTYVRRFDVAGAKARQDAAITGELKAGLSGPSERVAMAKAHDAASPEKRYEFSPRAYGAMQALYAKVQSGNLGVFAF